MASMYQGDVKFTREQLVFVVEAALTGAFEQSRSSGAMQTIGKIVPILWAQLNTTDGAVARIPKTWDEPHALFYGWAEASAAYEKKWHINLEARLPHPNCRELAEKIIDENFGEYLEDNPFYTITIEQDCVVTTSEHDAEGSQSNQYSETMDSGQEVELNRENPFQSAIGGDDHLVSLYPYYPNNVTYTIPLWCISLDDRKRLEMGPAISAEVHSDDHTEKADFDALAWFKQASDDDLVKLAAEDFGGNHEADNVARWSADFCLYSSFSSINRVLDYASDKDEMGFEVSVNEEAARAWIENERPHLMARIDGK